MGNKSALDYGAFAELVKGQAAGFLPRVEYACLAVLLDDAYALADDARADQDLAVPPGDLAVVHHLAKLRAGRVLDGGQRRRPRPLAGPPTCRWRHVPQRLVRPDRVVDLDPPASQVLSEMGRFVATHAGEGLGLEGAVPAFDLALGLRVVGPAVQRADAQAHQAGGEPAQPHAARAGGGEGVVAQH